MATPGQTLLFQYGSNMDEAVLRSKIEKYLPDFAPAGTKPDLALLGRARLPGWRFMLDLFSTGGRHLAANVVESGDGSEVWGALYELSRELVQRTDGERSVLDRIEGHRTSRAPENYYPLRLAVEFDDSSAEAWTYVGRDDARERCAREHGGARVSTSYAESILRGARALAVPSHYVEQLQEILEQRG